VYRWKETIPSWPALRDLATTKAVRSSFFWFGLVAVSAKALSKVNDTLTFNIFGASIEVQLGLPFSWQCFFFSALFFGLAHFVYAVACPEFVKRFDSFSQFKQLSDSDFEIKRAFQRSMHNDPLLLDFPGADETTHLESFALFFAKCDGPIDPNTFIVNEKIDIIPARRADAFALVYHSTSYCRAFWRLLCASFYGLGGVLLLIVISQSVWFALKVLFGYAT